MSKPKVINVFGEVFKIEYVDLSNDNIDGEFKFKEKKILIDKNLKDKDFQHTLLHEIGHAMFHRLAWKQSIPHELEEIIVDSYATFLVDNFSFDL